MIDLTVHSENYSETSYVYKQCTWWVYNRAQEFGIHFSTTMGNRGEWQNNGLYTKTEHRTVKYLNNLIEQDHRPIKRRNKFYQSLRTASSTSKGTETIRGIYKKNRRDGTLFGFSFSTEIKVLMGIAD